MWPIRARGREILMHAATRVNLEDRTPSESSHTEGQTRPIPLTRQKEGRAPGAGVRERGELQRWMEGALCTRWTDGLHATELCPQKG